MVKLSECKFGDRFKTKGGRMAIFLHKSFINHEIYICAIERDKYSHLEMKYWSDGKRYFDNEPSEYDIKGKWEDEIEKTATPLRNKARYAESDKAHKGCKRSNGGTMVARHQTSKMS